MSVGDFTHALKEPQPRLRRQLIITFVTIAVFLAADEGRGPLYAALDIKPDYSQLWQRIVYFHLWQLLPPFAVAAIFFGVARAPAALGLAAPLLKGLGVGALASLPMLLTYVFFGELTISEKTPRALLTGSLLPGVLEEVFYRGLLFGMLFRFAGWGFVPAALLVAFSFGLAHVYQGNTLTEALAIAGITAFGGVWFAWLYAEWNNNLYVPIALHVLMNGYWELFEMGENALGGQVANIGRVGTIVFSIVITILMIRRRPGGSRLSGRLCRTTRG